MEFSKINNNFINNYSNNIYNNYFDEFNLIDIFLYIKNNFIQLLLLLCVFFIIFIIDKITQFNAILYGLPNPIPGISNQHNQLNNIIIKPFKRKKNNKI